ncbi:MAG: hypothetical protein Q4F57_05970 [Weeksellaceae bacterium]|nr:hypothetical protein [Weeksellaceae bacterium]
MSKYFENLSPGSRVHRNGKGVVDLTTLPSDRTCKKLYLQGFRHIGIKPAATEILKGCPQVLLQQLIRQREREGKFAEVEILQSLLKSDEPASKKPTRRKSAQSSK